MHRSPKEKNLERYVRFLTWANEGRPQALVLLWRSDYSVVYEMSQCVSVCKTASFRAQATHSTLNTKTACDSTYRAVWGIEGYGRSHTLRNSTMAPQAIMKITSLLEMLQISRRLQNRRVKINESHQMTACSSVFNNRYRSSSVWCCQIKICTLVQLT